VLLRALFLLAGVATLVSALIAGTQAAARIVLQRKALVAMHAAYQTRVASIQAALAATMSDGFADESPAATSCVFAQDGGACAIVVTASSHLEKRIGGGLLQANDAVDEGRVAAAVDVVARGASGRVLGERQVRIVFRTLHAAPWALVSGNVDAAFESAHETDEPGDDGGLMPAPSSPGSLIDVVYRNGTTGAEIPANVWRAATPAQDSGGAAWSP